MARASAVGGLVDLCGHASAGLHSCKRYAVPAGPLFAMLCLRVAGCRAAQISSVRNNRNSDSKSNNSKKNWQPASGESVLISSGWFFYNHGNIFQCFLCCWAPSAVIVANGVRCSCTFGAIGSLRWLLLGVLRCCSSARRPSNQNGSMSDDIFIN